ncbi:MAG: hypothetical protein BAA02_13030 [Paenibacillaceae bacterium ZCTH02-B3]|nr:MAG: hypothetical protein BAA02_13030 [Paenibacillaceae bacterium ZCTH02-B3]
MTANGRSVIFLGFVLFVSSTNLRYAITSVSPLIETIQDQLALNRSLVSLLVSIPVFCMGLFAPLASRFGVRWGIERSIFFFLLLIGIATMVRTLIPSPLFLLAATTLVGIGIAVTGPLLSGFVKKHFPDRPETMVGVHTIGIGFGASLAAGVTVPLRDFLGGSWELALSAWGIVAILSLLFWWPLLVRQRSDPAPDLAGPELGQMPWRNRRAWLLVILFGAQSGLYYSTTAWLAPFAISDGMTEALAGVLTMVFSSFTITCGFLIPLLMRRFSSRRKPWIVGSALFILSGLVCMAVPWDVNPWIYTILLGIGLGGVFPVMLILPLDETEHPHETNAWTAMMQGGGYFLSGLTPIAVGFIRDRSADYANSLLFMIMVCLVLLFFSLFLRERRLSVVSPQNRGKSL